ncbi:CPBP family intramembrane glutamic endopeptidase [Halovivax limisalsi]|uniref:CPBP family intramembrane glutamic endopeptidase n=1 Tax=Halovivax limisalsi TaxID=1453760 RepID=UPI001FFC7EC0|nr:CPBP family intramembrane glutamic endopeptidase [Halovivax limisalsi]
MVDWVTFAAIVTLLTVAMAFLSVRTQQTLRPVGQSDPDGRSPRARNESDPNGDHGSPTDRSESAGDGGVGTDSNDAESDGPDSIGPEPDGVSANSLLDEIDEPTFGPDESTPGPDESNTRAAGRGRGTGGEQVVAYVGPTPVTRRSLLLNVAATQALFLALVVGVIVYAEVPGGSLGLVGGADDGLVGLGAGLGLYGASEVGGRLARRLGVDHDEWLRESLAPTSAQGWAGLLGIVLPVVALFEELLFRGVLIGAFAAGFGVSPWVLAIGSSIVFSLGHGIQGRAGVVVTGVLGFVLAAVFVSTGSLLTVVVAHYVLNACEFVVHEGFDVDPLG